MTENKLNSNIFIKGFFTCLTILEDDQIFSGAIDGMIRHHSKNPFILKGHFDQITCLEGLKYNKLASGSDDNTVKIWNVEIRQCVATLRGHDFGITHLKALKDGESLISVSQFVFLHTRSKNCFLHSKEGYCTEVLNVDKQITSIKKSFDNQLVVLGSYDKTLKTYDTVAG